MASSYTSVVGCTILALAVACGSQSGSSEGGDSLTATGGSGATLPNQDAGLTLGDAGPHKPNVCTRTVNLTDVQVDRPEPFDVVIVADHSDSLSWSREHLASGLRDLLRNVRGSQARFYVLTPTQYGASSEAAKSRESGEDLVEWKDPVTRLGYPHAMTEYVQTCTNAAGSPLLPCPELWGATSPFSLHGEWQFKMPAAVAEITPDMSDAELIAQQSRVANAIQALGGGGADREQPLCSLNRYLTQPAAALPQNVVFLVLSDEDDTSTPPQCLTAYDFTSQASTAPACTGNCTKTVFQMEKSIIGNQLDFKCVPVDDTGTPRTDQARSQTVTSYNGNCPTGKECSSEDLASALWGCGDKHVVTDCRRTCVSEGAADLCQLEQPTPGTDWCSTSFTQNGQRYSNFADYCSKTVSTGTWQNCKVVEETVGTALEPGKGVLTQVVPGTETSQLIDGFKSKASQKFGAQGFQVSSVILDPAFNCPLGSGQSYGKNLRTLATNSDHVHSLCGEYSDALQGVETFARQLLNTDYAVKLKSTERIDTVTVMERAGAKRDLAPADWTYVGDGERLKIAAGVLRPNDVKLEVHVEETCEVVLR